MTIIDSIILGIVEGLTEFLPVSSTGHMILADWAMNMQQTDFLKTFEVVIQLGAILAVMLLYHKRFLRGLDIYFKLFVAFLPSAVVGLLAHDIIKGYLFNPTVVSASLIVGGALLILTDRWLDHKESKYVELEDISYRDAFKLGCFQCVAMIPGVSRSAATILGGAYAGFNKKQATEFSFLLAVPTMVAATGYSLYKHPVAPSSDEFSLLGIGFLVAFISGLLAIKGFIAVVQRAGFKYFGYYRIAVGVLFLLAAYVFHMQV